MTDDKKFSIACTEVLEILKNIDEEELNKIDKEFISLLEESKDISYVFDVQNDIDFSNLKLTDETNDLLAYIYRKYWADEKEKIEFDSFLDEKEHKLNDIENYINNENKSLTKNLNKGKINIFIRIYNWIKDKFKR